MIADLRTLIQYRELLWTWTWREIKVRYQQSVLGVAWAILQPLALMLIFTVIFSVFVRIPTNGVAYPVFSYAALLSWTFFSTSVSFGIPALVNNLNLVTKIYFPREILPIASVGAALADFAVASSLFVILLVWYRTPPSWALLWVPALVVLQIVLTLGIVIPASAMIVFYRDVRFVIPLALQVWLYASPIIYPVEMVPERFRLLYALNPMVGVVESYRRVVLFGQPPEMRFLVISIVISVILFLSGYTYFKRAESAFADLI